MAPLQIAEALARPIVRTAEGREALHVACDDTALECVSELVVYVLVLACAVGGVWALWRRCCYVRVPRRVLREDSLQALTGQEDSPSSVAAAVFDQEELPVAVSGLRYARTQNMSPAVVLGTPGLESGTPSLGSKLLHRQPTRSGSSFSLDSLESDSRDSLSGSAKSARHCARTPRHTSRRACGRRSCRRRTSHALLSLRAHRPRRVARRVCACSARVGADNDISVDEYAPQLCELKAWVKDVVTEVVPAVVPDLRWPHKACASTGRAALVEGGSAGVGAGGDAVAVARIAAASDTAADAPLRPLSPAPPPPETGDLDAAADIEAPPATTQADTRRSQMHVVTRGWLGALAAGGTCSAPGGGRGERGAGGAGGAGGEGGDAAGEGGDAAGEGGDAAGEGDELGVMALLDAFSTSITAASAAFGPLMAPALKNDARNVEVIRSACAKLGRPPTLRLLLKAELATGIHRSGRSGMALREGACCCRSVVWLRRSLAFQTRIVEKISREHGCSDAPKCGRPLKKLAAEAYAIELEEFHNWVVRSTFQLAMNAMPSKEEILARRAHASTRTRARTRTHTPARAREHARAHTRQHAHASTHARTPEHTRTHTHT